eukprot:9048-Prorocentrum_minimum.AAC.3
MFSRRTNQTQEARPYISSGLLRTISWRISTLLRIVYDIRIGVVYDIRIGIIYDIRIETGSGVSCAPLPLPAQEDPKSESNNITIKSSKRARDPHR